MDENQKPALTSTDVQNTGDENEPEKFELLKQQLNKGVLKDMQQQQDFWQSYQNWSESFFKIFYDSFLKP